MDSKAYVLVISFEDPLHSKLSHLSITENKFVKPKIDKLAGNRAQQAKLDITRTFAAQSTL